MGKTAGHLALSGLIIAAATVAGANVVLSGLRLQVTERERVLHTIWAETATLAESGDMAVADALTLRANEDSGRPIHSFAPSALVYLSNERPKPEVPEPPPTLAEIRRYSEDFTNEAMEGDVLLLGEGSDIHTEVGDEATLDSERLIWSSRYERLIVPVPFRQTNLTEAGEVVITGVALSVDNDFLDWTYFSQPDSEILLEYAAHPEKAPSVEE